MIGSDCRQARGTGRQLGEGPVQRMPCHPTHRCCRGSAGCPRGHRCSSARMRARARHALCRWSSTDRQSIEGQKKIIRVCDAARPCLVLVVVWVNANVLAGGVDVRSPDDRLRDRQERRARAGSQARGSSHSHGRHCTTAQNRRTPGCTQRRQLHLSAEGSLLVGKLQSGEQTHAKNAEVVRSGWCQLQWLRRRQQKRRQSSRRSRILPSTFRCQIGLAMDRCAHASHGSVVGFCGGTAQLRAAMLLEALTAGIVRSERRCAPVDRSWCRRAGTGPCQPQRQ